MDQSKILKDLEEHLSKEGGSAEHARFFGKLHHLALKGLGFYSDGSHGSGGESAVLHHANIILSSCSKEWRVVFDVGANRGSYSELASSIMGGFDIYSFEPCKASFDLLKQSSEKNARVKAFNFGFSDAPQIATIHKAHDSSMLNSLYQRRLDHIGISLDTSESIMLKTIDDFCSENNIERIGFLKIDVEGHELAVLKGAKRMLSERRIRFIQFEFGGTNIDSRTFFQDFWYLLSEFNIYRIMQNGICHLSTYSEAFEIFLLQNFLAELKA